MRYRNPSSASLKRLFMAAAKAERIARERTWTELDEAQLLDAIVAVYPKIAPPPGEKA